MTDYLQYVSSSDLLKINVQIKNSTLVFLSCGMISKRIAVKQEMLVLKVGWLTSYSTRTLTSGHVLLTGKKYNV